MRRLGPLVGILVAVLGLVFVGRSLARSWDDAVAAASGANPLVLLLAVLVAVVSMGLIGAGWRRCLAVLGVDVPRNEGLHYYYVGQLGKYVPGGIWPVIGRSELARRGGVPAAPAYASTVLSLGLTYLAAILLAMALLFVGGGGGATAWLPLALLVPLGIGLLHPAAVALLLGMIRKVTGRTIALEPVPWPVGIGLLLRHLPPWIGVVAATLLVAGTLDTVELDVANIAFATTLSWVVGFLAVGVPGGVGVREAVFIAMATSMTSPGTAAAVAIVARVVFVLGDLSGAAALTLATRGGTRRRAEDAP